MIKKRYLKTKPECKVYFKLNKKEAGNAESVSLVGNFNNWDPAVNPMKKLKNGDFTLTLNLTTERNYQFRYLVDGHKWVNDKDADQIVDAPFPNAENSMISI